MASWSNGNQLLRQFAFQTGSPVPGVQQHGFTFFYDYDDHRDYFHNHPFSGSANDDHEQLLMKSSRPAAENKPLPSVGLSAASKKNTTTTTIINNNKNSDHNYQQEMMMRIMRKRKLTSNQINALETSFQEEVKLEPDRKMKLSRELGLHPRQVAVWFQNRRARWKAKQLERLYNALRQEFDIISREKQNLQQEVMNLKARLDDVTGIQGSTSYTEVASLEETVESTSIAIRSSNGGIQGTSGKHQVAPGSYFFSIDDYNINPDSLPYWDIVPGCP